MCSKCRNKGEACRYCTGNFIRFLEKYIMEVKSNEQVHQGSE